MKYMVEITRITFYDIEAPTAALALAGVQKGEGTETSSETIDEAAFPLEDEGDARDTQ